MAMMVPSGIATSSATNVTVSVPNATPITFVVGPGETLFIPFGIWHTAKSLEPTISVAFDLLNDHNFPLFLRDVWDFKKRQSTAKAIAATSYAALGGVVCRVGDMVGVKRHSSQ